MPLTETEREQVWGRGWQFISVSAEFVFAGETPRCPTQAGGFPDECCALQYKFESEAQRHESKPARGEDSTRGARRPEPEGQHPRGGQEKRCPQPETETGGKLSPVTWRPAGDC